MKPIVSIAAGALAALALAGAAQAQAPAPAPAPPKTAREGAGGLDLTGQWVSVVTEDWRWRMVTPPKGDFTSVPLTDAGRATAYRWDLAADNASGNQCRAFGAGGVMRQPTRIRIAWVDDNTLKLETDAGQQTRLFHFVAPQADRTLPTLNQFGPAPAERTWQGESRAQWFGQLQSRGIRVGGPAPAASALRVVTRNFKAGYLRLNGVPYSETAVISEQFIRHAEPNGDVWITVTSVVQDPLNLRDPFVTSSSFKREADTSKWNPQPCRTDAPLEPEIAPPAPRAPPAAAPAAPAAPAR